jgi:hypothetical protein
MKSGTLPNLSSKAAGFALDTLRIHYHNLAEQYDSLASTARSQLTHINALISHVPSVLVRSFDLSTVNLPTQPKATSARVSKPVAPAEVSIPAPVVKPGKAPKAVTKAPKAATKAPKAAAKAPKAAAITKAPAKPKRAEIISVVSPKGKAVKVAAKAIATPKAKGGKSGKLSMKAPYGSLTMLEAIGSVLEANKGKPVSADSVVDMLYGSLSANQLKVAKDRVTKSLSKGKIEDRWDRVPNQMGVYTLSLASMK